MRQLQHYLVHAIIFIGLNFSVSTNSNAQYCDSLVPSTVVDLSASPNMNWISAPIIRDGNCCGTTNPDRCLEFIITLHPSAIAVSFNIASGAIPPGALFYQIDCGPPTPVGSPICLTGPGPHTLTFCKPGNNSNTFSITSYSSPIIGPDITLNTGCQGYIYANYYNETSINWTSIAPGLPGDFDYLLSCTGGCDTTYITAPVTPPAYVDYLVCGMDIGGCNPNPICDTIRVNFISGVDVNISAITTSLCAGETTTITANASGGVAPYSYTWNTAEASSSIVVGPGTYYVDVIDTSGCHVATDTIIIQQFITPTIIAGVDQSVCEGTPITLNGSGGVSYIWDNGVVDNVPFAQALGMTTYTVVGTDINGCTNTDQVNVTVNPNPIVDAGSNQYICEGEVLTLSGSGALTYVWDNGVTDGVGFVPAAGTINYTVIGTDANGCTGTDVVMITVTPLPTVNAGNDITVCVGNSVTLSATGTSSYNWDNGVVNDVPFIPSLGSTLYTVIGINIYGCTDTDQVMVTVNPLPNVNAGPDQIVCIETAVVLTGSGGMNYTWNNGVQNGVYFTPPLGTTEYIVNAINAFGCSNSDTVLVTVNPDPVVNAGPDVTVCLGDAITLSATGSVDLYWNNMVTNNTSFTPTLGITEYIVTDSLSTGCLDRDTLLVEVFPNPIISAEDVTICEDEPVVLNGQGAFTYSWSNGVVNGIQFYPNETENYTLTGTSADGCSSEITVTVYVNPSPVANFNIINNDLNTVNSTTGFVNYSSGASNYEWFFGDFSAMSTEFEPVHTFPYDEGATYEVTLVAYSPEGCRSDVTQYIVIDQSYSIFVPNAFTPDGNGVNEVFNPVLEGFDEQSYTLYIFNRWGELVFESHDMSVGWDGTYAGKFEQVQDGVCTWKVIARVKNSSEDKMFVGHVALLK